MQESISEELIFPQKPPSLQCEIAFLADSSRNRITQLLFEAETNADSVLTEELLPLVYDELKRLAGQQMAQEKPGQTLQPTALVHEAYLRLVGNPELRWESRGHFFAAAARSMRQILINRANRKKAIKHGGDRKRVELDDVVCLDEPEPERMIALDSVLKKLEEIDPRKGEIVNLRYFAGLTIEETASALGMSPATVKRDWQFARTWLHREMGRDS
ncbi:MAG: sigma-70 family RNA polymerase sigma factor [Planctomycetota bacterium]